MEKKLKENIIKFFSFYAYIKLTKNKLRLIL